MLTPPVTAPIPAVSTDPEKENTNAISDPIANIPIVETSDAIRHIEVCFDMLLRLLSIDLPNVKGSSPWTPRLASSLR